MTIEEVAHNSDAPRHYEEGTLATFSALRKARRVQSPLIRSSSGRLNQGAHKQSANLRHKGKMALVSAMVLMFLRCCRFHQGIQLRANLIDPLSQLLMLRFVRRGVTLSSEVVPVVLCDFCKLTLEGFDSVG